MSATGMAVVACVLAAAYTSAFGLLAVAALVSFLLFGSVLLMLADPGRDVYYYDQRGSGFSSRHDLRREAPYTVADHVADLEAIRERVGADRIIPVGHGWGVTLAVQYLLTHPERVERLVALSPAPLRYPAFDEMVDNG